MPSAEASVNRDGETLRFAGALLRAQVAPLWRAALPLAAGARRFDLAGVSRVDSAGVALLAELARCAGGGVHLLGTPEGYEALRAAYRLTPALEFAA